MTLKEILKKINEIANELNQYIEENKVSNTNEQALLKNQTKCSKKDLHQTTSSCSSKAPIELFDKKNLKIASFNDEFEQLKILLNSEEWPVAVDPENICDPNSENDKTERARGIIENSIDNLEGKKFLDFGCGEGHCVEVASELASLSVGYDINLNWKDRFQTKENMIFTNDFNDLINYGPFDNILMFDVLDHLQEESPVDALKKVRSLLKDDDGRLYCNVHPFVSKHATHLYKTINKAYVHLIFTQDEIEQMYPNIEQENNLGVLYPLKTYASYFIEAGLHGTGAGFQSKTEHLEEVPEFFMRNSLLQNRIKANININGEFPSYQLSVQFIDYVLKKV